MRFEEWCIKRVCSECEFEDLATRRDCRMAYNERMVRKPSYNDIKTIEEKLDLIIKHFNILEG